MTETFSEKLEALANEAEGAAVNLSNPDLRDHCLLRAQIFRQMAQAHRETCHHELRLDPSAKVMSAEELTHIASTGQIPIPPEATL